MPTTTSDAYAIVRTGGKQYRVTPGQELLVEKLSADVDSTVELEPLLLAGEGDSKFGDAIGGATVKATVVGHEKGPKVRIFKFKPKRGYKRTTGHRQQLTRLRVDTIG